MKKNLPGGSMRPLPPSPLPPAHRTSGKTHGLYVPGGRTWGRGRHQSDRRSSRRIRAIWMICHTLTKRNLQYLPGNSYAQHIHGVGKWVQKSIQCNDLSETWNVCAKRVPWVSRVLSIHGPSGELLKTMTPWIQGFEANVKHIPPAHCAFSVHRALGRVADNSDPTNRNTKLFHASGRLTRSCRLTPTELHTRFSGQITWN